MSSFLDLLKDFERLIVIDAERRMSSNVWITGWADIAGVVKNGTMWSVRRNIVSAFEDYDFR